MNNTLLKIHHYSPPPYLHLHSQPTIFIPPTFRHFPYNYHNTLSPSFTKTSLKPKATNFSNAVQDDGFGNGSGQVGDDLARDGPVYKNTLRLVECSMFAAVSGLAYLLSSSLAVENYFGCFLPLPIVISSMRWGVAGGRKTMVATTILLFVLSGPVKALTYMLMHGFLGFTMGSLWRLE